MTALIAWKPDDVILGFRIQSELAKGAASRVYLAWDLTLNRQVALKVSRESSQEAAALGQLEHPGIVPLYSRLEVESQHVLVLQYVPGQSLADHLADEAKFPRGVGQMMLDIAHAIGHVHDRGVWHLDVKPENILLTEAGRPVLIDFNVARFAKAEAGGISNLLGGTISYMSPEQLAMASGNKSLKSQPGQMALDHRSDIYSFGAVFYELLTDEQIFPPPIANQGFVEAAQEALANRLDAGWLKARLLKLKPPYRKIIAKCLAPLAAKKPELSRYQSMKDLVEDLQDVLAGRDPEHAEPASWPRKAVRSFKSVRYGLGLVLAVILSIGAVIGAEHWQVSARLERVDRELAIFLEHPKSLSITAIPEAFDRWEEEVQTRAILETHSLKDRRLQTEHRLGMAAIAGGENQRAIVLFERLLRKHPDLGEAWHNLGIARFRRKDYPKAIAAFSQALHKGADPAEVLAARAAAFGAMHDFANARPDIVRATELKPHSPAVKRQWALLNAGKSPNP